MGNVSFTKETFSNQYATVLAFYVLLSWRWQTDIPSTCFEGELASLWAHPKVPR